MQTLRPYSSQDENAAPGAIPVYRGDFKSGGTGGAGLCNSQQSTPGMNRGLGGVGVKSMQKQGGGLAPRKALGNITNMTPASKQLLGGKGGATPATSKVTARRALGDITNKGAGLSSKKVPQVKEKVQLSVFRPEPAALSAPAVCPREALAEKYALDGVEKFAGKTWEEQELDRQAEEDMMVLPELYGLGPELERMAEENKRPLFEIDDGAFVYEDVPADLDIPETPSNGDSDLFPEFKPANMEAILDALARVDTSMLMRARED